MKNSIARQRLSYLGLLAAFVGGSLFGCDGMPALIPNSDPALRRSSASFAADAAKRVYETSAQAQPDTEARAKYELIFKQVDLTNISTNDEWDNVEVWINRKYVVFIPKVSPSTDVTLNFQMFFDSDGNHFETDSGQNPIKSIDIYRNGTMYSVPMHVAE